MIEIYQQALIALTTFPGNLVYHIILAFSIAGALHGALNLWRQSSFPQGQRMVIGLGLLLGMQFVLFFSAGLTSQGLSNPLAVLPLMDRAATSIGVILFLWLWIFPEPLQLADATTGVLGLLTLLETALSWAWWSDHYTEYTFNSTRLDLGWEVYALALLFLGIALIIVRRPNGWGYGLGMMLIVTGGHILHLITPLTSSDYPGAVRLAQMAAYPLLITLPRRFSPPPEETTEPAETEEAEAKPTIIQDRPRYGVEPKRFQAILSLAGETSSANLCKAITRAVAETMLADICLLIYPPSGSDQYIIQCGYDLIREVSLETIALGQEQLPLIDSAMQQSRSLRLPSSSTSRDLSTISHLLGLAGTGHLLAGFVPTPQGQPFLGIILLSPHSDRRWSREDQSYLEEILQSLVPILQRPKKWKAMQEEIKENENKLQTYQHLLDETQAENDALQSELDRLQSDISQEVLSEEQAAEFNQLKGAQRKAQDTIARLQVENQRLSEMVESLLPGDSDQELSSASQIQEELHLALEEIAHLKKQLSLADQKTRELAKRTEQTETLSEDQIEVFASIAQDLRQPMSSITGYTGLLLDESVGILGALQRKFLERIRASAERMEMLLDDLIHIAMLDSDQLKLTPEEVDLGNAIDRAIADTSAQLREKNIVLRVDLPEKMPRIHADRDALQQILIHLLKNAGAASPVEGEIYLRADIPDAEDAQEFVLIQVADQGGGIPKEDLPRVFSRLYRADNPLIEGVGDTGVGLSIAKTLVEAHNGRIWVDTERGVGSTFSLLFPLSNSEGGKRHSP
jgi:signal transduction histidine kinase